MLKPYRDWSRSSPDGSQSSEGRPLQLRAARVLRRLNELSRMTPDTVRGLLDELHEVIRKLSRLEPPLQSISHVL